jgi:hypothetical protein
METNYHIASGNTAPLSTHPSSFMREYIRWIDTSLQSLQEVVQEGNGYCLVLD